MNPKPRRRKPASKHQLIVDSAFWREEHGCFFGYFFFVWEPIFDPTVEQYFRPIQKKSLFPVAKPLKTWLGQSDYFFILDYFFLLCRPLIQMNTQDMYAPKHHCIQHIAKSQTRHCYIARCMWSKLHTEKTNVSDDGHRPKRYSRIPTVFFLSAWVTGWVRALAS